MALAGNRAAQALSRATENCVIPIAIEFEPIAIVTWLPLKRHGDARGWSGASTVQP